MPLSISGAAERSQDSGVLGELSSLGRQAGAGCLGVKKVKEEEPRGRLVKEKDGGGMVRGGAVCGWVGVWGGVLRMLSSVG